MNIPGSSATRGRIRDVIPRLRIGRWPPGPLNSITDVPEVLVHTESIQPDRDVNTGVTTIVPRADWVDHSSFAGVFRFNGAGELTGAHWIEETGLLVSPIILTGTPAVGDAVRGVWEYAVRHHGNQDGEVNLFLFPAVTETFDGYLSSMSRFPVTPQHVVDGIMKASSDQVPEGNTGGGTGMICHGYKGGTGSSSRTIKGLDVDEQAVTYTVGVLVQANYGAQENLHIGGVPVGRILKEEKRGQEAEVREGPRKDGSIIVVVATDAPLVPVQLQRLAKRATIGLAKVGGYGSNTSGDIFLAFSSANKIPSQQSGLSSAADVDPYRAQATSVHMVDNNTINGLFEAAADATEEAIYNALFMGETMIGFKDRKIEALDVASVKRLVEERL